MTASEIKMKYNVLRLYISAFHPKALNVVVPIAIGRSGRSSGLVLTDHLPADEQLFYQQWYEDSASQWSIVNGQ